MQHVMCADVAARAHFAALHCVA